MIEAKVYNFEGQEFGQAELPETLFGQKWNNDLVHQVALSMQANLRRVIADTKDRSQVRGGGKKPWRQKGTGQARHGSRRSPIWIGGGVTHGPTKEKNYSQKINQKMKVKAFFNVLSRKLADGEVIFVQDLPLATTKTKQAQIYLNNLAKAGFERINYKRGKRVLLTWPKIETAATKSFQNIPGTATASLRDINLLDLLNYKYVVLTKPAESLTILQNKVK
ncbi:MAG: 50S ribosomal protein L4 [Candidatus Vogelbacteria bacterium CG10_big_fil_rev_8_21_14_0_10_49_38]|uniref:Large ribosomal subunit protein uL4 n=1 Tax=Candidatus Vogelbacteria bacterium CG10_big_fil_rev_8_21_14_0_10_49_38 TaxID=1975043 RepID=A0A2H0RIN1_9BACT|nr:MAG: 50S ribosomal protein L4 [bacterium CG10_49_38]PIR46399.1 MAG: 50S ribosomal protein L4 [Candidatus Vogelbacteria bacterium CG10_big_fil_rev_8_21_14_0_10_49_38]